MFRSSTPRFRRVLAVTVALLGGIGAVAAPDAISAIIKPVDVEAASAFEAGNDLTLSLTLEEAAHVIVVSDPPGAVSYEADLPAGTSVVEAQTDPNTPPGEVTVYAFTDGAGTDATLTEAQ
jgi:hypothetical protein